MNATASPHLESLADEAVTTIREGATECENPVLLFSGGKDSAVLLHLAALAFAPARSPFPVMHVDTGHDFGEVMVRLSLSEPIVASPYEISHEGGRLILVDEATNTTAGAMMITVAA